MRILEFGLPIVPHKCGSAIGFPQFHGLFYASNGWYQRKRGFREAKL
jgi:hypothetical protein